MLERNNDAITNNVTTNPNIKIEKTLEVFPKNEDFGKTAWTICDLDKAIAKFNELENE